MVKKKKGLILRTLSKGIVASVILTGSMLTTGSFIPLGKPEVAEAAGPVYTVTASNLNVRTGPGTNFARIGGLPRGSSVQVIQIQSNGWYKISYKGKTAYVSGQYVTSSSTASTTYRVTASALNVRTGPGTKHKKIGQLKNGAIVKVIKKESNGWYRINYNGKTGFVSGQYITTSTAAKLLNVPLIAQRPELPSGCEVTSLAMALNYYGVKVSKGTLARKMPYDSTKLVRNANGSIRIWGDPNVGFVGTPFDNGYTINPGPLKRLLDQYRPGGVNLTGKNFSEVEAYVKKGAPVLVWFTINYEMPGARSWKTSSGKTISAPKPLHCIVVTGVDDKYVYFNDSEAVGKNIKVSKSKFISIYNAMGKRALVVK
ncbi:SH3 domain-containing protein [Bacillus sp. B-jedd]|uniref:SH3 domain-containing protein n=1 Tax=Bacillus sp. B-jedd TaxID=1476857 RepID=UPI00051564ED|nr:SH3 domain-containing protein [Bacillus sp. B-jedd]CEG28358.1 S-layer domain-containing protein [Bacillus sp. B-jedd]